MGKWVPNPAGIAAVGGLPGLVHILDQVAQVGEQVCIETAPVDEGDWRDGFDHDSGIEDGQAIARIFNTEPEPKALAIEFGTSDTPTWATLRKGAEAAKV